MLSFPRTIIDRHTHHYRMLDGATPLTVCEVIDRWQTDEPFVTAWCRLLAESPFTAYRWETPASYPAAWHQAFECVLLDAPHLQVRADRQTFAEHFPRADATGIVSYASLGGDTVLISPAPLDSAASYPHLAAFLRTAPIAQQLGLWRHIGQQMAALTTQQPRWLSTAGGGVAWLHVRIDPRPKYYGYAPYKIAGTSGSAAAK
jgi:hypothetical protein